MPNLAQFLSSADGGIFSYLEPYLPAIKSFSALISILLFTGIVIIVVKLNKASFKVKKYREIFEGDEIYKHRTVRIWKKICADLESGDTAKRKFAIIEADKVLDEILKLSGYSGEDMGERLKQVTTAQLINIDDIWTVHKIRNQIAHETDYDLSEEGARRAIAIYATAFRQLGLID